MTEEKKVIITPNKIYLPIAMLASILITVIAAYGWLETRFKNIEKSIQQTRQAQHEATLRLGSQIKDGLSSIDRRVEKIEDRVGDRWSKSDMKFWVEKFKAKNPSLIIPDVQRVSDH